VLVAGEWHGFQLATATAMTSAAGGVYSATLHLEPGLHAYKFVVDNDWRLDPNQGRRKYFGTPPIENSAIKVPDCRLPTLTVASSTVTRPSAGAGTYQAELPFTDGIEGSGPDGSGYSYELQRNGETVPIGAGASVDATGAVTVSLNNLQDGKYRLVVTPKSVNGRVGEPLRLVFWVEAETFSWKDAIVYMVLTDRYRDGESSNNPGPTPGADPRGDWQGGDLQGVKASIEDGSLDALGVRAIWLTPFQTNPVGAYLASDGEHKVTGYHGYWPVKAREVDPRLGGEAALRDLVNVAHAHGIRIMQDFVLNHVHEDHEYVASHSGWFRTGCVCGSTGCDWTTHALDCMFSPYMPDIDHTVPEANAAFVDDAVWWMDEFDLDGLRVDAVKHVEEVATRNLAAQVRETFEATGVRHFLMGETAMGWNDCADPCNDENYGTISRYIGPHGLDGQFDFVLYHGVSLKTFATDSEGMLHADYWFQHGMSKYPAGAVMTPYIGSHDTPRFVTVADPSNASKANNQWEDTAGAPTSDLPYERARVGFAWLLNLPGAPLLYYGDEYGQWGGADPNNRLMWKPESALNARELATLTFLRKLGMARKNVPALRRGDYVSLAVTEDTLVFGRKIAPGNAAIVGLTRASTLQSLSAEVANALGLASGTVLSDRLGGPSATVTGAGTVSVSIPAKGAVVLSP
jgi:glycosidase